MRILCLAFLCFLLAQPAAAQSVALRPADTASPQALALAMPGVARALLREPGPQDKDRLVLMRLQLLAGQWIEAQASIEAIRLTRNAAADSAPAFLGYEWFAAAHAQTKDLDGKGWAAALQPRLAAMSDRQAVRAQEALQFRLPAGWQAVQQAVGALRFDADGTQVAAAQALALVNTYLPYWVYEQLLPPLAPLLAADEERRYLRDEAQIRSPNGVLLSAYVLRPRAAVAAGQRLPTALVFSIYAETERPWRNALLAAAHGFASVAAFSRGKLDSPSPVLPYEHEATDVNTVIDWISQQSWSDGQVGMHGGSYDGFAQWAALKTPHPALKTIVPVVAAMPGLGLPMENNVALTANYGWAFYVGNSRHLDDRIYNDRARWQQLSERWYASGRPFREIDQLDREPNAWLQRWLRHERFDAYWQAMVPYGVAQWSRIKIPVLSITGYYDDGQISALEYLRQHEAHQANPQHVLLIGPWDHFSAQSSSKPRVLLGLPLDAVAQQVDSPALAMAWLDHVLRGAPRPALLKDRINYQVTGRNTWANAPSLRALHAKPTRLYLQPAATGAAHRLSPSAAASSPFAEQRIDLADRSSTSNNDYYPNPIVRAELDRSSGLLFTSDPLPAPRLYAGSFSGKLRISINKRDVDLGLTLFELTPEGEYLHLSYFLGRASHGHDLEKRRLLRAGQPRWVRFERTRMNARELRAGSRLVLVVDVNKNSGAQVNLGSGKPVSDEASPRDAGPPLQIRWLAGSYINLPLQ